MVTRDAGPGRLGATLQGPGRDRPVEMVATPSRRISRRHALAGAATLVTVGGLGLWRVADSLSRPRVYPPYGPETAGGWTKYGRNPVFGPGLGTCFDVCLLRQDGELWMWFSWRPHGAIGVTRSLDGIRWERPAIALGPAETGWEDAVNRPSVIRRPDGLHMWYTGQTGGSSAIGHAHSVDGRRWTRLRSEPVLQPERRWESSSVMAPSVLYDEAAREFRMWFSAGGQFEPKAIGHATSSDGDTWTRNSHPVFASDAAFPWERDRVAACQVLPWRGWYVMFYIGFYTINSAQIGLARSRDGISRWERHPANPIVRPSHRSSAWDYDAVYKPFAVPDGDRWLLYYNGRHGDSEQIGLAAHNGLDLGFRA